MTLTRSSVVCIVATLTLTGLVAAQDVATNPVKAAPAEMTGAAFAKWLSQQRDNLESEWRRPDAVERAKPLSLEGALKQRLRADRLVTDDAVMVAVDAWRRYEEHRLLEGVPRPEVNNRHYTETKRFIDELIPLVGGGRVLEAQLRLEKARLLSLEKDDAGAASEYDQAFKLFDAVHISVDRQRLESLVALAGAYYLSGNSEKAEPLYQRALGYPWWKIQGDAEALQAMRSLYIQAGRNLIDIRRNDLQSLKNIFFVPAVQDELGPYLQQRIEEAQRK